LPRVWDEEDGGGRWQRERWGWRVDLSIFRVGPGSGRAGKNSVISGRKNLAHDLPTGRVGPQFSGRARAGPERAACAFYSVKQLKTAFWVRLGPKTFSQALRSLPTPVQPVRFVGGPSAG
jgi:hypothetical protein